MVSQISYLETIACFLDRSGRSCYRIYTQCSTSQKSRHQREFFYRAPLLQFHIITLSIQKRKVIPPMCNLVHEWGKARKLTYFHTLFPLSQKKNPTSPANRLFIARNKQLPFVEGTSILQSHNKQEATS